MSLKRIEHTLVVSPTLVIRFTEFPAVTVEAVEEQRLCIRNDAVKEDLRVIILE